MNNECFFCGPESKCLHTVYSYNLGRIGKDNNVDENYENGIFLCFTEDNSEVKPVLGFESSSGEYEPLYFSIKYCPICGKEIIT